MKFAIALAAGLGFTPVAHAQYYYCTKGAAKDGRCLPYAGTDVVCPSTYPKCRITIPNYQPYPSVPNCKYDYGLCYEANVNFPDKREGNDGAAAPRPEGATKEATK
jgi:hypothetical protein